MITSHLSLSDLTEAATWYAHAGFTQPCSPNATSFELLDCTLRDGSYAIPLRSPAEDTCALFHALHATPARYVEIGSGIGLGAWRMADKRWSTPDSVFFSAGLRVTEIRRARGEIPLPWGVFFLPSVATADDLSRAIDHGMGFIRFGIGSLDRSAGKLIDLARQRGLVVAVNLLKSHLYTVEQFAMFCRLAEENGATIAYLVDSTGSLIPSQVRSYVEAARAYAACCKIGFHGHNNLSLAVANSLEAISAGAQVVDTTLFGVGRSSGNTCMLQLLGALIRASFLPKEMYEASASGIERIVAESLFPYIADNGPTTLCTMIRDGVFGVHSESRE